jgi:hypothetical protein
MPKTSPHTGHIAIYGSVKVKRIRCVSCDCWTIVASDGKKICCDMPVEEEITHYKSMISSDNPRKQPSKKKKAELLEEFNNSCCYCDKRFGSTVSYNGKERIVRVAWDHVIPYSYSLSNENSNFLPSCNFCNSWKSNLMFETIDDVRVYVNNKWENEGFTYERS